MSEIGIFELNVGDTFEYNKGIFVVVSNENQIVKIKSTDGKFDLTIGFNLIVSTSTLTKMLCTFSTGHVVLINNKAYVVIGDYIEVIKFIVCLNIETNRLEKFPSTTYCIDARKTFKMAKTSELGCGDTISRLQDTRKKLVFLYANHQFVFTDFEKIYVSLDPNEYVIVHKKAEYVNSSRCKVGTEFLYDNKLATIVSKNKKNYCCRVGNSLKVLNHSAMYVIKQGTYSDDTVLSHVDDLVEGDVVEHDGTLYLYHGKELIGCNGQKLNGVKFLKKSNVKLSLGIDLGFNDKIITDRGTVEVKMPVYIKDLNLERINGIDSKCETVKIEPFRVYQVTGYAKPVDHNNLSVGHVLQINTIKFLVVEIQYKNNKVAKVFIKARKSLPIELTCEAKLLGFCEELEVTRVDSLGINKNFTRLRDIKIGEKFMFGKKECIMVKFEKAIAIFMVIATSSMDQAPAFFGCKRIQND